MSLVIAISFVYQESMEDEIHRRKIFFISLLVNALTMSISLYIHLAPEYKRISASLSDYKEENIN